MKRKDATKYVVVEWSKTNRRFHIDRLDIALTGNMQAYLEQWTIDYIPVAILSSYDEAGKFIADLKSRNPQLIEAWIAKFPDLSRHLTEDTDDWPQAFDD